MNKESQILNVPIEDIIPNRFQPRLNFDETGLKELADSIKQHGIIQPLVLRKIGDKYEIIAGERRYKASKMAGLTSVPAVISVMDDNESAEVAIVENIQRRDLSAIEEAKSYKTLLDKGYLTQEELAKKMGISQSAISNKMRLLSLDEKVQKALMEGKISERHARSLLKVEDKETQVKWLERIINERLTVQSLEKKLKEESNMNLNNNSVEEIKVEDIKSNATDIVSDIKVESSPIENDNNDIKPMPNKFFNFLEDESVNMNTSEPEVVEPKIEEEIEMLDFEVPIKDVEVVKNVKDMTVANNLVGNLINSLKDSNYQVNLETEDESTEIKYTIVVKKED